MHNVYRMNLLDRTDNKSDRLGLMCGCGNPTHAFIIDKWGGDDEDEYLVSVTYDHFLPWYRRLPLAISYLFGRKNSKYMFVELWLEKEQLQEIQKFIEEE